MTLNRYVWRNDSRDLQLLGGTFANSDTFAIELAETDARWGLIRDAARSSSGALRLWSSRQIREVAALVISSFAPCFLNQQWPTHFSVCRRWNAGVVRLVCTVTQHDEMVKTGGEWFIQRKLLRLDNPF